LCLCSSSRDSPPPSNDRVPSPNWIPWVRRASSSLSAPCSVRHPESSASDSASATVANAGRAPRPSLAWHGHNGPAVVLTDDGQNFSAATRRKASWMGASYDPVKKVHAEDSL
jgi:hypothetical protein